MDSIVINPLAISSMPTVSVETGDHLIIEDWAKQIKIVSTGKNVGDIYYTIDGSIPDPDTSTKYTGPFYIGGEDLDQDNLMVVVTIGVWDGRNKNIVAVKSRTYLFNRCNVLNASLPSGTYSEEIEVSLTAPANYDIYYTLNGESPLLPSGSPSVYASKFYKNHPIALDDMSIKAVAVHKYATLFSKTLTLDYLINKDPLTLAASHSSGTYSTPIALRLTCSNSEAMIKYTLNGDSPLTYTARVYDTAVILGNESGPAELKAVAITAEEMSAVTSLKFNFKD